MLSGELGYLVERAAAGWLDSRVRAALLAWALAAVFGGLAVGALAWLAARRRSRPALAALGVAGLAVLASLLSAHDRTRSLVRRDLREVLRLPANATSSLLEVGRARGVFAGEPDLVVVEEASSGEERLTAWLAEPTHAALVDTAQQPGAAVTSRARTEWRGAGLALVFGGAPGHERAPVLASLDTGSADFVWETVDAGAGTVRVVAAGGTVERILSDPTPRRVHRVRIPGLRPGIRYEARVEPVLGEGRGMVRTPVSFTTLPAVEASEELRLAVVGDSGGGSDLTERLVDEIRAFHPSLVLHVGDLAYDRATPTTLWDRFYRPFEPLMRETGVWAVPGNHDICDGGWAWREFFGLEPSRVVGRADPWLRIVDSSGARIVSFNSNAPPLPSSNARRELRRALGANARWKVAFFHHPVISAGGKEPNPVVPALLHSLLVEAHVDLGFSGHSHNYQRCSPLGRDGPDPDGVRYVVSGGGGGDLDPTQASGECVGSARTHFVRIRIRGGRLWLEAVELGGAVLDHVLLEKQDGVVREAPWVDPAPNLAE